MPSLPDKFSEIEKIILERRDTLALHSGVPFLLLVYPPNEENDCRDQQLHLKSKLSDAGLCVHDVALETFLFDHYKKLGLLETLFEKEIRDPLNVYRDIAKNFRPALARHIIDLEKQLGDKDAIIFLTQVAHLYPFVRVSNLLYDLENRITLPLVIFYPGEETDGELRFLGFQNADGPHTKYRARRI